MDKRLSIGSSAAQLSIWDTAGQERFHALGPIYYRDADGALLVYDITDYESFAKVQKWVRELRSIVGSDIAITIAGNKYDLEKNRVVPEEEALRCALAREKRAERDWARAGSSPTPPPPRSGGSR